MLLACTRLLRRAQQQSASGPLLAPGWRRGSAVLRAANVPPVQPGAFGMAMPPAYGDSGAAVEVLVEDLPGLKAAVMHRPKALNAMNTTMVERLTELYARWEAAPHVGAILLKGFGSKAFCAGGDVRALVSHEGSGAQRVAAATHFFRVEDALVYRIATLHKPHVAILDGIVMGGGAGVSMNGAFRVATERSVFAMPECVIGFFPDVGATHFLNKLPGRLGICCALTGMRLKGKEMRDTGLATHYVLSDRLPRLMRRLVDLGPYAKDHGAVDGALREFEAPQVGLDPPEEGSIMTQLPHINTWFAGDTVEAIDAALEGAAGQAGADEAVTALAASLLKELRRGSPTSLKVGLEAMNRHRNATLRTCLIQEFRLVKRFMAPDSDFYEGVTAQLITKTGKPHWRPASLADVTPDMVAAFFEPLQPKDELELPAEREGVNSKRGGTDTGQGGAVRKTSKSKPQAKL